MGSGNGVNQVEDYQHYLTQEAPRSIHPGLASGKRSE